MYNPSKTIYSLLLAAILFPGLVYAQGVQYTRKEAGDGGTAVPYPLVTVCTSGAAYTPLPCTPKASIYSDAALTVPLANPFRGDMFGNIEFYATPAAYIVSVTAPYSPGYSFKMSASGGFAGTIATTQVAVGTALNTLGGSVNFTYDPATKALLINGPASSLIGLANPSGQVSISGAAGTGALLLQASPVNGVYSSLHSGTGHTTGIGASATTVWKHDDTTGYTSWGGSTSGRAGIGTAAVAGTPNTILLPLATGAANSLLQSDGANPQQSSWTTTLSGIASLNGVLYMGTGTGQYTSLQAAHDALPSTGGTIRITPVYIDTETATVNITKPNVTIQCQNQPHFSDATNAGITFNHTSVGINVTGKDFGIEGCELKIGTTTTRVGVPLIDSNVTEGGRLSNILLVGQGASANNGIFFRSTDTVVRQGIWQLDNIINRDGATWTSIATVSIASNTLTGAYYKFTDIVNSYAEKYTDAAIVLDGTIDTVEMDRISTGQALATGGKTIWIRNTVSASGIGYPRWVHCNNCYLEAGGNLGGVSLQIDSGRDINYSGYIASSTNCVNQTNAFVGVNIHDVAFTNIFGTCIAVTGGTGTVIHHNNFSDLQQGDITYAGGGGILIDGNTFRNDSAQTTNTYDTIQLAAGTGLAQITSNNWLNQGTPKPRYGINFLGNFNASIVANNNYAGVTFGTGFLNPPANNLNMQIIGQDATVIGKLTSTLTAIGFYSNLAGACTNGELALSANWGNTGAPTVTAAAGIGQTCQWTITAGGAATGASPTITDTLVNALPAATIVCEMRMVGGTGTATLINQTSLSATAPIFTFGGTPGVGLTYIVVRRCGP